MNSGKIEFEMHNHKGVLGFDGVPKEILEKVLMILICQKDVRIDSDGELHTNFYKNKKRVGISMKEAKNFIDSIPKCEYY